jgi:hypothetical protein
MPNEYKRLCQLYANDAEMDTTIFRSINTVLNELVEELRIEFGLPLPLRAIFLSSPNDPDEATLARIALEATADRSWIALLTIVLKAEKYPDWPDWLGAHFRFRLELKPVVDNFYNILLWPGADPIRVRLGDSETYHAVSLAISASIEAKLRDPKSQGPERFAKRESRRNFVVYYQTELDNPETELVCTHVDVVPRVGESIAINHGSYKVTDVVWLVEGTSRMAPSLERDDASQSRMSAIVIVTAQPPLKFR